MGKKGKKKNADDDEKGSATSSSDEKEEMVDMKFTKVSRDKEESGNEEEEEGFVERPVEFSTEEKKRTIGSVLRLGRFGVFFFIAALFAPFLFVFIMFGVIPLGDPETYLFDKDGAWPQILVINPTVTLSRSFN